MSTENNQFTGKNITTDTHVYFYTNWLSNFKACKIIDPRTGLTFDTTEQIYMWYKADFFNDRETRAKLEVPLKPQDAKNLGREVANYDDAVWTFVRFGFMTYVNYLKYTQNEDLQKKLLETQNRILVEASPTDKVWGVGFYADNPLILDEKNWTGQNLLGKSIMAVRDKLNK